MGRKRAKEKSVSKARPTPACDGFALVGGGMTLRNTSTSSKKKWRADDHYSREKASWAGLDWEDECRRASCVGSRGSQGSRRKEKSFWSVVVYRRQSVSVWGGKGGQKAKGTRPSKQSTGKACEVQA